jgi:predicted RNA-binding protein with PUA-like domain
MPPKKKSSAKKGVSPWAWVFDRKPGEQRFWLVKVEPDVFSFDTLLNKPNKTTHWDGVRNFVARNFLRDGMKVGDRVFYYHSGIPEPVIVGICEVVREGYPDPAQYDPASDYYDAKATPDKPIWFMTDLRAVAQLTHPVTLAQLKQRKELKDMALLRIGRLSVTPVRHEEWKVITALAER